MIVYVELSKIVKKKIDLNGKNFNELSELCDKNNVLRDNDLKHILELTNYPELRNKFKDYISPLDEKEYLFDKVINCFEFNSNKKIKLDRNYIVAKSELESFIMPIIKKEEDIKNFKSFILDNFNENEDYVFFEYYPF